MLDPVTTPLLFLVLGSIADDVIGGACKDFLKAKLAGLFSKAATLGSKGDLQIAYEAAMQQAYETCCEVLLRNIETFGVRRSELPTYRESLVSFIKDPDVASELFGSIVDPNDQTSPSPQVLSDRWQTLGGRALPSDQLWVFTASAYRNQALQQSFLSAPLREILMARDVDRLLKEVVRQGGVRIQVRRDKYAQRMRNKFSPVDLANLMPAYADDPGRLELRDVFVPQTVRENPLPVELPKDVIDRLKRTGKHAEYADDELAATDLESLRSAYMNQSPKPVLDVIAAPAHRLLVLTGDPGSGKSTLLRYLLMGIIETAIDRHSGLPLPWTLAFEGAFPLLIELRDFYALRRNGECDSFLEYVGYMGKTDQWFLDDLAVQGYLETGPSLVMFDGLDEIFDAADRQRVAHEIAGFAQRYPRARIIVTSRPVGYREQVLRDAGFVHFGIQDLDDEQINMFTHGWFALTFPQRLKQADQRVERVLGSIRNSPPIRLLAGNPMLLTIMALLAREEELPRERVKFYEKAVEVLCHHWDANRNLGLPHDGYLNADDKKNLLRRIAMRMQGADAGLKGNVILAIDLEQEIQAFLMEEQWQPNAADAKKAARQMIHQLRERNHVICLRGPHLYGFVHRTFLEYLTAAEYVRMFDKQPQQMTIDDLVNLFDKHCTDYDWREVLRLICGQINEQFVGRIIEHLSTRTSLETWSGRSPLPELQLAISCLSEVRSPNRLEAIGSKLLTTVTNCFLRGQFVLEGFAFELVRAARDVGTRWPGKEALQFANRFPISNRGTSGRFTFLWERHWPHFLSAIYEQRCLFEHFARRASSGVRRGSIEVLAERWPDEMTRTLLAERAVHDEQTLPREAALHALAERWPDETTRTLLTERAVQDEDNSVRTTAMSTLATKWPDETTRARLTGLAVQNRTAEIRGAALQTLATTWPDETTRTLLTERAVLDAHEVPRRATLNALAKQWPDEITRTLLAESAVHDENETLRRHALDALAKQWPDEITRTLLAERAVHDEQTLPREAALHALAERWPDETTRTLLTERTVQDEDGYVRGAALDNLARKWPDEITRTLLTERAFQDEHLEAYGSAMEHLATLWPDETTRSLFTERAREYPIALIGLIILLIVTEEHPSKNWPDEAVRTLLAENATQIKDVQFRIMILEALTEWWPDETTRSLLTEHAVHDENETLRRHALDALAKQWPDEMTRTLLAERAVHDEQTLPREAALHALAERWPDETTRTLLTDLAAHNPTAEIRGAVLRTLAREWPDENTRSLLAERAVRDENVVPREAALHALAERWPDETTRSLLAERAVQDQEDEVRGAALQTLATRWPDEMTRTLLAERVHHDQFATSILGSMHSRFGRIVVTSNLDGCSPYLDPRQPVCHEHILEAADKVGITPDEIDDVVRSLSRYLGWDITRGAAAS